MVDAIMNKDFRLLELDDSISIVNIWTRVLKRGHLTGVKTRCDFFVCQNIDATTLAL